MTPQENGQILIPADPYFRIMPDAPFYLAVSALIRNTEGRVLLLKRAFDDEINPGKWDLPGGKPDPGETFDQALVREVSEEAGLRVALRHVAGAGELILPAKKIAYLILECDADATPIRLSPEHEEYAWVDPAEAAGLDLAEQFRDLFGSLQGEG